jgi:hypothetical protein
MRVWVITTCVPGEPEPCWPSVYSTKEKAEAAFDRLMRAEWSGGRQPEDDEGNLESYPDGDAHAAHARLADYHGETWGQWEIYPVGVDDGYEDARSEGIPSP